MVIVKNHNSNDMRVPSQKVSKSIIVHQHRNAHVIQSYGRYNDVMSHENFDQEYYEKPEKVEDLYNLDESIQVVPKVKQHVGSAATGQTAATSGTRQYMLFEDC